jgi:hypothetical protein
MLHIPGWKGTLHFLHNHFVSLSLELLSEGIKSSPEPLNNRILVMASSSSLLLKTLQFLFALHNQHTSPSLCHFDCHHKKIYHSKNQQECSKVMNVVSKWHNHRPLFTLVTTWQNPAQKCCIYWYHATLLANCSWMQELTYKTLPNHNQIQQLISWTASSYSEGNLSLCPYVKNFLCTLFQAAYLKRLQPCWVESVEGLMHTNCFCF